MMLQTTIMIELQQITTTEEYSFRFIMKNEFEP